MVQYSLNNNTYERLIWYDGENKCLLVIDRYAQY